jgi:3-polyprenyl-4-hydroxybenzoate decarboxylase
MVRETAAWLWNTPWFSASRLLIFVDAGVEAWDMAGVAWSAINNCDFFCDSFSDGSGKRQALDATGCRNPRQLIKPDRHVAQRVAQRWNEYGLE